MKPIELTFNFVGVSAAAWEPAFRFFNEILGIQAERRAEFGDWAVLGGGWDAYHNKDNRSAVFELFDNGRAVTARRWGLEQGIRPAFHVPNLPHAVEDLRARGITQIGDITERPWSKVVEFTATEGIRFAITEIPGLPSSDNLAAPYIGHVAIKTVDLTVARSFYGDTIGYTQVDAGADYAIYAQQNEHPLIILERGGEASAFDPRNSRWKHDPVRAFPVFISMMTPDIRAAHAYLQARGVTMLRGIVYHDDWGGTDVHIADPDGNAIQVVQYGHQEPDG